MDRKFPGVYHFSPLESRFRLYLGEYSTCDGLQHFDPETLVKITVFVDEKEGGIPNLGTVAETIEFLENSDHSLIDFTLSITGFGSLSTHDDGECHFEIDSEDLCFDLVGKVAPKKFLSQLITEFKENPGLYFTCDDELNRIIRFESFDAFLKRLS